MADQSDQPDRLMTTGEAREYLNISRAKMAKLIRDGVLKTEDDPLDERIKLIRKSDLDALRKRSHPCDPAA